MSSSPQAGDHYALLSWLGVPGDEDEPFSSSVKVKEVNKELTERTNHS